MTDPDKPLNVWSNSDEELGRLLSNFSHTPFELDGIEYASLEAFYVSLLVSTPGKRDKVRTLYGVWAKRNTPQTLPQTIDYQGYEIELGTTEHHALIKRALHAKIVAHPNIKEALIASRPRNIIHETGAPRKPNSHYPREVFARQLMELREEFAHSDPD